MASAPTRRLPDLLATDYDVRPTFLRTRFERNSNCSDESLCMLHESYLQDDPEHLRELEPLARQIDSDIPDERMDAKAVAKFQRGILQFMESALGPKVRTASPERANRQTCTSTLQQLWRTNAGI
jgi:hypothetical protein